MQESQLSLCPTEPAGPQLVLPMHYLSAAQNAQFPLLLPHLYFISSSLELLSDIYSLFWVLSPPPHFSLLIYHGLADLLGKKKKHLKFLGTTSKIVGYGPDLNSPGKPYLVISHKLNRAASGKYLNRRPPMEYQKLEAGFIQPPF